jgi:hypothetical protein
MLVLTEVLEKIMSWLKKHQLEYANSFLPGLQPNEIQAVEEELGFNLPKEIYELYKWRNGTEEDAKALCFPTMQFLPLTVAVKNSQAWNKFILEEKNIVENYEFYRVNPLFIFLQDNCNYCAISLIECQEEKLPVVTLQEGESPDVFYTSLTNMMLTLAECYEIGAYYLDEDGYVCEDKYKTAQVLRKHNADISERALLTFESLFSQSLNFSNSDLIGQIAKVTTVIVRFKEPRGVILLAEALQTWSREKSLYRDGVCSWVIKALGEMCDIRALQPLTNALQDDSDVIKKEAQEALSKLRQSTNQ